MREQKERDTAEGTPRSEKKEKKEVVQVLEQRFPATHGGLAAKQIDIPEGTAYL